MSPDSNALRRRGVIALAIFAVLSSCSSPPSAQLSLSTSTPYPTPTPVPNHIYYVDGAHGSDSNPGTPAEPWQTIKKATDVTAAGDLVYLRGGNYPTIYGGWNFKNSGRPAQPITLSNLPGEQVIIAISGPDKNYGAFRCWYAPTTDPPSWQTPRADFIRIMATDVPPHVLSNGVLSRKGIVIQGVPGGAAGIETAGCDNWEVAGIDFVSVPYGMFIKKRNFGTMNDYSSDNYYVHDNRVYGYYNESGMQFNGDHNLIEHNEIYKVFDVNNTTVGCQLLNILGNNNIIRGNILSRLGGKANCMGILFEWDLADNNWVTENTIQDVPNSVVIAGGDNNVIETNVYTTPPYVYNCTPSPCNSLDWPWNETVMDADSIPPDNPAAPDWAYYYPHKNETVGNVFLNNGPAAVPPTAISTPEGSIDPLWLSLRLNK